MDREDVNKIIQADRDDQIEMFWDNIMIPDCTNPKVSMMRCYRW